MLLSAQSPSNVAMQFLSNAFQTIYNLGRNTIIYSNGNINVTLNSFLLCLFLLGVSLSAFINFVRYRNKNGNGSIVNNYYNNDIKPGEVRQTNQNIINGNDYKKEYMSKQK